MAEKEAVHVPHSGVLSGSTVTYKVDCNIVTYNGSINVWAVG
jgi:hypothetical protein